VYVPALARPRRNALFGRTARWVTGFGVMGLFALWLASPGAMAQENAPEAAATMGAVADAAAGAAQEVASLPQGTADILWLLLCGILVMFMQAGFAMVETGLTRSKNAVNIMTKNVMDFSLGALLYWAVGYAVMYGENGNSFIGWDSAYLFMGAALDAGADSAGAFSNSAAWFFQMVFCATAATIVSGAMAERTKLAGYFVYAVMISGILYPITGSWIWGPNGWLGGMGMRDFAGSTVVHSVGAWAALAGAIMVGPRLGKYNKDGSSNAIPGHNLTMAALGVFILWFGWYGFNPGSTLAAMDGIAYIAVTTTLAAGAGGFCALMTSWFSFGKPDLTMGLNGVLAGLVGITAPCASVEPWAAVVIGGLAGILVFYSVLFIDRVLKVDDPVGAISVHGVCGAWGTLSIGIFGSSKVDILFWDADTAIKDGLLYGGGVSQLGVQAIGVVAVFAFAMAVAFGIFAIVKATVGLRVSDKEQIEGLDLGEHDMAAYPDFQGTNIKSYHLREA
jgi:Amt family ammonium transporter